MGWRNSRDRQKARNRHGERFAGYGRVLEEEMVTHLTRMKDAGDIDGFVRHTPNSTEDEQGKDFTVTKIVDGEPREVHLGVTISIRSWHKSRVRHAKIAQLCFPIGTKPETIRARILELFATMPT